MKVSNFKPLRTNSLVASFDLLLPSGIEFHGLLLFRQHDKEWISFPGIPYVGGGKTKYKKLVGIPDRSTSDKFNSLVIGALKTAGHI